MRLRVCVYVCTSDEFCAEEKECVSRSQGVSIEKSESACREVRERVLRRRDVKQNRVRVARKRTECIESCEKENRVYRELRQLRTQCILLFNINKPILFIQF